ncbi:MAG: manB [Candidatus Angelobacter sp.]|jgi:mannose-1-phosphate guanylyltransferase|nr:manB [Candidatus Angelobacter sp.]
MKKAFLLAAGSGTRLRPLTDTTPKCLLPIQGVPLLQIWLENCEAAGIREVLINVHSHPEKFRSFVSRSSSVVKVHIAEESSLLGSAGTLAEHQSFVAGEESFFVLYGDVLTNISLLQMLAFHQSRKELASLAIHQVPDPTQCGVVSLDNDAVIRDFKEKPEHPESDWAFSGVMIAHPQVLDFVPMKRPADIGFHLLPMLAGKMAAFKLSGYLLDIGTLQNYAAAQSSWPGLRKRSKEIECCRE